MFVTTDRNLIHQQNLAQMTMAIVVLLGKTNRLADLEPLVPKLLEVLPTVAIGEVAIIEP